MDFLTKFYDAIYALLKSNYMKIIFFISLYLILLVFIVGLVVHLVGDKSRSFRKSAKLVLDLIDGGANEQEIHEAMKSMPLTTASLWNKYHKEKRGKPSDYLTPNECLYAPLKLSWLKTFAILTIIVAAICSEFIFTCQWDARLQREQASGLLMILGLILGGILFFIYKMTQNLTIHYYEDLIECLNEVMAEFIIAEQKNKKAAQQAAAEEPVMVAQPAAQPQEFMQSQEFMQPQDFMQQSYQPQPAMQQPFMQQPAMQQPFMQQAAMQQPVQPAPQPMQAAQSAQSQGAAQSASFDAETLTIINNIEKAIRANAPANILRQLSASLQRVRAKPSNQTPANQQRLNRVTSVLAKAIAEADK